MKLENRAADRKPGRVRSAEVMRSPEDLPERIFDPRLDLGPGVYEELRKTVKREAAFLGPKKLKIPRLSWMSWFDPSYRDDLQGIEQYKEYQLNELKRQAKLAKITPGNLRQLNRDTAYFLQQFPEDRSEVDDFTSQKERGLSLVMESNEPKNFLLKDYLVVWLQIWPQHRDEIVKQFFPQGVDELINSPECIRRIVRPSERIHFVAQVMLVFPEHREHLLKLVERLVKNFRGMLEQLSQGIDRDSFNEYHQLIGDLTIIGAKEALIDQQGLIRVELQPLSKPTAPPAPLPDRSTL